MNCSESSNFSSSSDHGRKRRKVWMSFHRALAFAQSCGCELGCIKHGGPQLGPCRHRSGSKFWFCHIYLPIYLSRYRYLHADRYKPICMHMHIYIYLHEYLYIYIYISAWLWGVHNLPEAHSLPASSPTFHRMRKVIIIYLCGLE